MPGFPLIIVPDPEEPGTAEIFVEGRIGRDKYRFLLDTGAGRTFLKWSSRNSHFLKQGDFQTSGIFRGHNHDLIQIPSLSIGSLKWKNIQVARSQKGGEEGHDLIGMDLLKQHCLHFQFHKKRVDVVAQTGSPFQPKLTLNTDKAWHAYVEVDMSGTIGQGVWDTGASITVVDQAFISANTERFSQIGTSKGTDASGKTMETPLMEMKAFQIGGHPFPTQRVASVDLSFANKGTERPMNMILGYNTLCHADWLFDFPNRKWAITKMYPGGDK